MGTAYLVEQGGQQAVLKLFHAITTHQERMLEARNLYNCASLGVSPAPLETFPDGIVMEYLPTPMRMPFRERARLLLGNLNRLHNRGFVHRDLKPDNMVGTQIIDLGSLVDTLRDCKVEPIGTPGYAAKEAYQGVISPLLDAYAIGQTFIVWLGGPEPQMGHFGMPPGWMCPQEWQAILPRLVAPAMAERMSVAQAFHLLTAPWCHLADGTALAADLVTAEQWQSATGHPCQANHGYAVALTPDDVRRYLAATGTRLPTLAEMRALAAGTERQAATRDWTATLRAGLVSDGGARNGRRWLWQPTSDGLLFGGTAYADAETMPAPVEPNAMVGLRVAK
jgi:serine/threonine protein kinase